jgi:hypothetical protein
MPTNLQVDSAVGATVQAVKDATGQPSALAISSEVAGIRTTAVGKALEIVGDVGGGGFCVRETPTIPAAALGFSAHVNGLGSLWTNAAYDPADPSKGWKRTLNLSNGNVGVGRDVQAPDERLVVDGNMRVLQDVIVEGDVRLVGSDCAEDFDVDSPMPLEPGTVMVISGGERLCACYEEYDRRVAGVLSGAGTFRPGIILGRHEDTGGRMPLALTGRVYCKVDASYSPIAVGDLLTTSQTPGHAMCACDSGRAFGAILGKALRSLPNGRGLIPVLVTLH